MIFLCFYFSFESHEEEITLKLKSNDKIVRISFLCIKLVY
jgi:hypothetical protein